MGSIPDSVHSKMRVFLFGLAAVAAQQDVAGGNTAQVSSNADTTQTQMVGNDNDSTNMYTNQVTPDGDDRIGSPADPSTWMGLDTLDEDVIEVPWDNRADTYFHNQETSADDGDGWGAVHKERSYKAIKVKNLYCDGVEKMEFELELHDEHRTMTHEDDLAGDGHQMRNSDDRIAGGNNEVKLSKFLCRGKDGDLSNADAIARSAQGEANLQYRAFTADDNNLMNDDGTRYTGDFNGIDGMVSLNPYKCDVDNSRDLLDSDLSDATTTVNIEFRVVSSNNEKIEFHKYLVEASCEFNKIYNARTAFSTNQQTTAIDTEIFQLLDTDFGMHMSGDSTAAAANSPATPTFRANENIEAVIYTNGDTQSRRKWEKLNIKLGYAPIQCKVEQQSDVSADNPAGAAITIFDITRSDDASNQGRGGHPALEMQVAASTHLRIWYMKYIAFVMAEDDATGSYELQCALQPCYYDQGTTNAMENVCVLALSLMDVEHEAEPLGDQNTWNTLNNANRDDGANDWSHLFDTTHQD